MVQIISKKTVSFIGQKMATQIDEQLFSKYGFKVEQLMELAGLAAAQAIVAHYPKNTLSEIPMPKGASCPQSILRPSLLFYLTPVFIAFLIFNKNITSDIRHMYGN
ncbi:hypothetical protein CRE_18010 [Caenorhabditis remanei]|uniref:Uncharacterized protein n=1 Tax=Caenorhabditis remanei TaxID=31234 RepID=E3MTS6_CAERE|nr:hypothetical protein CRE_18010 [Caenorhabditis remanei]